MSVCPRAALTARAIPKSEYLDRNLAVVLQIGREVHQGHPTGAEFALDGVTVSQRFGQTLDDFVHAAILGNYLQHCGESPWPPLTLRLRLAHVIVGVCAQHDVARESLMRISLSRAKRSLGIPGVLAVLVISVAACGATQGRRGGYMEFMRPDQRPPLVGTLAAADSLWGLAAQSQRGDGIAESHRGDLEALVRRFTPTLVLPNNDHVTVNGHKYKLLPTDIHLVTDTLRLDLIRAAPYTFQDSVDVLLRELDTDSLVALTLPLAWS